ncbi:MAG: response regulator transcription factor [Chloroflexi bacterium]|nr:response regulator transcription factor [Chloroflexota bacterium]
MKPIRVFVVDDHPLMRNALEMTIEAAFDMQIVGQASNGKEALRLIPLVEPDIVLMDLMMPEMGGLEVIHVLSGSHPGIRTLVLSSLDWEDDILKAIQSGASGYITKSAQRDELLQAVRTVNAGEVYLPPKIAAKLISSIRESQPGRRRYRGSAESLTPRQAEVLDLLGQGFSDHQIAEALNIADATVRLHILHILNSFGFENRRELMVYAVEKRMESESMKKRL